LNALVG